ncbi:molecular chaperone IbpA [Arboricoccus pini]|uniref:Molecular chaperone IbpA n=1 Tax=Arboricoccus pini TaxID=1963835 RepID=A0A212R296_9PROT|nr:Hsp20 family protein [Arboricoccus pini]SNB66154.1 molecular chaperone IbpA [Arboricoccus pini]
MSIVFNSSFDPFRGLELFPANGARKPLAPAYDLVAQGEHNFKLALAVPGYAETELSLTVDDGTLIVRGEPKQSEESASDGLKWIRRGISHNAFEQRFALAEHVQVKSANLANGVLEIELERVIPEALKPRTIAIGKATVPADRSISQAA